MFVLPLAAKPVSPEIEQAFALHLSLVLSSFLSFACCLRLPCLPLSNQTMRSKQKKLQEEGSLSVQ